MGILHGMSLFGRVVAVNAAVLVIAALVLALSPATVSSDLTVTEAVVLAFGTVLMIVLNVVLLRRVFGPLEQLARLMREVDPLAPGRRIELERPVAEVEDLSRAFNTMLDRLEAERRSSGRRALLAQEHERKRLARELHDELGQTLTGVLLQLDALRRAVPESLAEPMDTLRASSRESLELVREIARGLRPQALDDFGLRSALVTLATSLTETTGVDVTADVAPELPVLAAEEELAIYRVAQESLTNVARHADARHATLKLARADGQVVLTVRDDGRGIRSEELSGEGVGLGGMRERSLLVGGTLTVERAPSGGTEVQLRVPVEPRA